jgi:hypothetical protein
MTVQIILGIDPGAHGAIASRFKLASAIRQASARSLTRRGLGAVSAQRYRASGAPSGSIPRRRDSNAEARIQIAIVQWIRLVAPQVLAFHPANGGWRSKAEAARFKAMGVLAGVPDIVVIAPGGKAHFLEIKTPTGRLSDEQREIMGALGRLGVDFATVTSIDDVRRAFSGWGIETREALLPPYAAPGASPPTPLTKAPMWYTYRTRAP